MSNRFVTLQVAPVKQEPLSRDDLRVTSFDVHTIVEVSDRKRKVTDGSNVTVESVVELYVHVYTGSDTAYRYHLFDTTAADVIKDIEQRIHCEMDYARTGATVLRAPDPVRLGVGGAENNESIAEIVVADIDLYPTLRFKGRAGADTKAALLSPSPFTIDVPTAAVAVANTPTPSKAAHLVTAAGTVYVSRSVDGTKLYVLGEDSAAACGLTVEGLPQ